jgi:hypothetical protein
MADFMVASDQGRFTILRQAKYPPAFTAARYAEVRRVLTEYLADDTRNVNPLATAEQMFEQRTHDASETPFRREVAEKSAEFVRAIQRMQNKVAPYRFRHAPSNQPNLIIFDVEISVQIDLIVYTAMRGQDKAGGAHFRLRQDDTSTERSKQQREELGRWTAVLEWMHMSQNFDLDVPLHNKLCLLIDIMYGEIIQSPQNYKKRMNNIESACRMISALWPTI